MHYKQAYDAGVPVALPALNEVARSSSSRGSQYLIMAVEYIHQDAISSSTVEDLVQFCCSLVDSVDKLHQQAKLLHCDLKPDNVRWRGQVVHLIDFGHAQPIGSARSRRSTEGFEAPEILKEELPWLFDTNRCLFRGENHSVPTGKVPRHHDKDDSAKMSSIRHIEGGSSQSFPSRRQVTLELDTGIRQDTRMHDDTASQ
jgi:serine/threonine protein kinase